MTGSPKQAGLRSKLQLDTGFAEIELSSRRELAFFPGPDVVPNSLNSVRISLLMGTRRA